MAKKIEMLNDQQEVVHPLTSSDCVIMENGKTLEEVMGDGIATPTVTHEGASFQVGVGDSNIEVVDGDVAGMTLEGQTYQNILPKPTTLIMETDEKEFKINDKIDNNIVLDDNVAEIATIKGQTYVNVVQEESATEYTVLGEELSGQSITTTGKPEGYVKNATLEGLTLVNTIQEPSEANSVVLDLDADINAQGTTINNTVQGGIHRAILKGQTLVNLIDTENGYGMRFQYDGTVDGDCYTVTTMSHGQKAVVNQAPSSWRYFGQEIKLQMLKPSTKYFVSGEFQGISTFQFIQTNGLKPISIDGDVINNRYAIIETAGDLYGNITSQCLYGHISSNIDSGSVLMCNDVILVEYQEGMENWDIPYFEGMQSVEVPSVMTTGKNLFDGELITGKIEDNGKPNTYVSTMCMSANYTRVQPNTTYNYKWNQERNNSRVFFYDVNKNFIKKDENFIPPTGGQFTTPSNCYYILFHLAVNTGMDSYTVLITKSNDLTYEPYKSSTLTTGKLPLTSDMIEQGSFFDSFELNTQTYEYIKVPSTNTDFYANRIRSKATFKVHGGDKYIFNLNTDYAITLGFCKNGLYSAKNGSWITNGTTITIPSDCDEMFFAIKKTSDANIAPSEFSSVGLEIRHLVNLRKVGDVQDELDLETGKLTQRIGEVVLDGSEEWTPYYGYVGEGNSAFVTTFTSLNNKHNDYIKSVINDKFISTSWQGYAENPNIEAVWSHNPNEIGIRVKSERASNVAGFKAFLSANNIKINYELEIPTIKTVDLSIVDQDNNPVKSIQTHPTLTHVSTSSQGLIPNIVIPSQFKYPTIIKPSTTYTVQLKQTAVNSEFPLTINLGGTAMAVPSTKFTITTPETLTSQDVIFTGKNNVIGEVVITEGDTTGIEYDYFEGMNDVKSPKMYATGKNLVAKTKKGAQGSNGNIIDSNRGLASIDLIKIKNGSTYILSGYPSPSETYAYALFDKNKNYLNMAWGGLLNPIDGVSYVRPFILYNTDMDLSDAYMQLEEGSTATSYEPYKGVTIEQSIDSIPLTSSMFEQGGFKNENNIKGMSLQQYPLNVTTTRIRAKTLIKVKPNTRYLLKNKPNTLYKGWCLTFDKNGDYTGLNIDNLIDFTTNYDVYYIAPVLNYVDDSTITPSSLDSLNLTLQEVTDEIVLRSLPNGVKDTLNLTTGEYVQRVGEVVLDGSESWNKDTTSGGTKDNTAIFFTETNFNGFKPSPNVDYRDTMMLCDKFPIKARVYNLDEEGMMINQDGRIYIRINQSRLETVDMNGFKKFLLGNNVKVECELATPIIKKVNLTNTTKLPSYTSTTHYDAIVPSNSLVPNIKIPSTIDYNVAIKPSTQYTIRANTTSAMSVNLGGSTGTLANGRLTLTTPSTLAHNSLKLGNGKAKEVMVVEGSEIKDNVPFFNGMKNVQMGGIKLVNIARGGVPNTLVSSNANGTQYTYTSNGSTSWGNVGFDMSLLKTDTIYTVYMEIVSNTSDNGIKVQLAHGNVGYLNISAKTTGVIKQTVKTAPSFLENNYFALYFRNSSTSGQQVVVKNFMVIEGDWTHLDEIPYIESEMIIEQPIIRSQGKNIFDINGDFHTVPFLVNTNTKTVSGNTLTITGAWYFGQLLDLKPNTVYTASWRVPENTPYNRVAIYANNTQTPVAYVLDDTKLTFTTPKSYNDISILFYASISNETNTVSYSDIQLEEGSSATTYEPFKQHTLSSNRVIGYEEGVHYGGITGIKSFNPSFNSVMADVEGLSIAYVTNGSSNFSFWDKDMVFISGKSYLDTSLSTDNKNGFIQVPSNAKYMKFASANTIGSATDYTKATVTGELPLRSLPNGVCDSFNLVTGEYVQRIKEVTFDGTETWGLSGGNYGNCLGFIIRYTDIVNAGSGNINFNVLNGLTGTNMTHMEVYHYDRTAIRVLIGKEYLKTQDADGFKQYLSQNPITVQYELETPIVRKIGLTAKGVFAEASLGDCEWGASPTTANNTFTTRYRTKSASSLPIVYNTHLFTDDFDVRHFNIEAHGDYEYVSNMEYGQYVNVRRERLESDTLEAFNKWLAQNPIKVGYITWKQTSSSYSNIQKPIFFNDIKVEFMYDNVDIQPSLTYQARTLNSYVMDMMKANTVYTLKALANPNSFTIDGTSYSATTNGTFTSPSTLTNKLLITGQDVQELMIIEGDVTSKQLPYYKGIRSSFDNTDEIEVYSVNKNLFDMNQVTTSSDVYKKWETNISPIKNEIISKRIANDNQGAFPTSIRINVKPGTRYCLRWESDNAGMVYVYSTKLWDTANQLCANHGSDGMANFVVPSNANHIEIGLNYGDLNGSKEYRKIYNIALYEVNELQTVKPPYIPHSHNTTLIEMPTRLETVEVVRPIMEIGRISEVNGQEDNTDTGSRYSKDYIPVEPNMILTFMNGNAYRAENIRLYGINKNYISAMYTNGSGDLIIPKDCYFIRFYSGASNTNDMSVIKKQYKPIALNSLPNGVKDELIINRVTSSAKLIQRAGKIVLDGGEGWSQTNLINENLIEFQMKNSNNIASLGACDKFVVMGSYERIAVANSTIYIRILKSKVDSLDGFRKHLSKEPVTVYYELAEPVVTEIRLKGYPFVYKDGSVQLNTEIPHTTKVKYNVNQEHLINGQNETIIRHDKQIDNLYDYIELYLEEEYRMELFRMQLELSL